MDETFTVEGVVKFLASIGVLCVVAMLDVPLLAAVDEMARKPTAFTVFLYVIIALVSIAVAAFFIRKVWQRPTIKDE